MITARVETRGVEEAKDRIEKRIFRLTGQDPAMFGEIQKAVYVSTATNFASQGRPRWTGRSPSYEEKATWPILAKTGKLLDSVLNSIQRPWEHRGKSHFLNIYSVFYGLFHEYGKGQKVRRFVSMIGTEKKAIAAIIKRHIHVKRS
jgi:phage gpG-like protein